MLDAGTPLSTPLRTILDELSSSLGSDVRPQKSIVKELLLSVLRERATA